MLNRIRLMFPGAQDSDLLRWLVFMPVALAGGFTTLAVMFMCA